MRPRYCAARPRYGTRVVAARNLGPPRSHPRRPRVVGSEQPANRRWEFPRHQSVKRLTSSNTERTEPRRGQDPLQVLQGGRVRHPRPRVERCTSAERAVRARNTSPTVIWFGGLRRAYPPSAPRGDDRRAPQVREGPPQGTLRGSSYRIRDYLGRRSLRVHAREVRHGARGIVTPRPKTGVTLSRGRSACGHMGRAGAGQSQPYASPTSTSQAGTRSRQGNTGSDPVPLSAVSRTSWPRAARR